MPDPLYVLPNELWSLCIELAIDGRLSGPLEYVMVSTHWKRLLLGSPSLWTQIYIQNGEDETARISTFLHLSKQSPLHIDVMTVLPTVDSLRLVAEHIYRVGTILIRPGASETVTALHAKQWKLAASYVLAALSNGMQLSGVESPACSGVSLWDNGQPYYHVICMQFTVAAKIASADELNCMWEEHVAEDIPTPEEQDSRARTTFISAIAKLASYSRFHAAIRIAIPSFIKLLQDDLWHVRRETAKLIAILAKSGEFDEAIATNVPLFIKLLGHHQYDVRSEAFRMIGALANRGEEQLDTVQARLIRIMKLPFGKPSLIKFCYSATFEIIGKLSAHVEFREAITTSIPTLINLLKDNHSGAHHQILRLTEKLAKHIEFHEAITAMIPSLINLLEDEGDYVRWETVRLIGKLGSHVEFREATTAIIPVLNKLLEDDHSTIRLVTVKAVGKLANHVGFRESLATTIPILIKLLEDGHAHVRREAFHVVGDMKSSGMFQPSPFALDYDNGSQRRHQVDQG